MPDPVNGNFHLLNITPGDELRPGDIVSARVSAVLPGGRFQLYCNGRLLTAKSSLSLHSGQILRARVERNGKELHLHLLDGGSKSIHKIFQRESIERLLPAALLRAGLSLTGEGETRRRAALLNRTRGSRLRVTRLYAEMLAKGIDPGAAFLESLDSLLSGGGRNSRSRQFLPDPEELREELCGDTSGENEISDENDNLLNLLNDIPGKKDTWLFKRLNGAVADADFRMVWKIRRGMDPALALTVYDGERTFEFLIEGLEKPHMAVYVDENTEINEKKWVSFRKTLALMNFTVDDTLLSISSSDGFTAGSEKMLEDLEDLEERG